MELPRGAMGLPPKQVKGPSVFGIDVRPGSWDVVGFDAQRPFPDILCLRLVFAGKLSDEDQVLFAMRQYSCKFAVCDSRPDATIAVRLQQQARKFGIHMDRCQYATAPGAIELLANEKEGLITLERTMTMDTVHFGFQTGLTIALPQNFREIYGGEFASEICSPTRVPSRWHGVDCYRWEHTGPDHTYHAINYALVAAQRGKLSRYTGELMLPSKGIVESTLEENIEDEDENWWKEPSGGGRGLVEA